MNELLSQRAGIFFVLVLINVKIGHYIFVDFFDITGQFSESSDDQPNCPSSLPVLYFSFHGTDGDEDASVGQWGGEAHVHNP